MNQRRRDLLRVTCKCAIFTPDKSKVLLADYGRDGYGLPGGHIDAGESPDEAMRRELDEELGVKNIQLRRVDFFIHPNGKIVLGFMATMSESSQFTTQPEEINGVVWQSITEIRSGKVSVPSYRDFILAAVS